MEGKKMFTKVNVNSEELQKGKDFKMSLEYYLLESIYKDEEETQDEYTTYGVEVVKKEYDSENVIQTEQQSARHISVSRQNVERLLEDLSDNMVTPVGLFNVLDNLLGVSY